MPTLKEASAKRRRYAWMIKQLMEEKERAARARLVDLQKRQTQLKPTYEKYLELYQTHIKPLMTEVDEFWGNVHELRKIEHFLQGQAEHREAEQQAKMSPVYGARPDMRQFLPPQVERLPYAGKSDVGRRPSKEKLEEQRAKELLAKIKEMNPEEFNKLLIQIGGIK